MYPNWAESIGWCLALSSILMIPFVAIIQLIRAPGNFKEVSMSLISYCVVSENNISCNFQKLAICITPIEEHEQLRESKLVSRFKAKHWLYV